MQKYGYARVSTKDQNLARQLQSFKKTGIKDSNIYCDKATGSNFQRREYQNMLKKLKPNDTLVICSIDRLGRNYEEILEQWRLITQKRKANIEVLDMPLLNTNYNRDGLTGIFISELVLQILAYVAEKERENIKERQAQGIAIAKANGVKFGRKPSELPPHFDEIYHAWETKKIDIHTICKRLDVNETKFYTYVRRYRQITQQVVNG